MNQKQQKQAAKEFAARWRGKGYEKGETHRFWIELLGEVLGVEQPTQYITFEDPLKLGKFRGFIDGYIDSTKVIIEQKSLNKNLRASIVQSDGTVLTPFQQAKRYSVELPLSKHPRWVITSNFQSFLIYDMEKPHSDPIEILLENLEKEFYRFSFIVNKKSEKIQKEEEISFQAGEIVGELYDAFAKEYNDLANPATLHSLNELCVRLVFCLYAEDALLFGKKNMFHDFLARFEEPNDMRRALIQLFSVLDTPESARDPYDTSELSQFPYVNGGLFSGEIEIPFFTPEIRQLLLEKASDDFDWSEISPTIFGAVFESTLNPETRHSGGMHYTSIENIHKVIDPLFLDDLKAEFAEILQLKEEKLKDAERFKQINRAKNRANQTTIKKLEDFQQKLASLTFFDPACGSGNFLTETFLSLRRLENDVILAKTGGQIQLDTSDIIKVKINQFYGIEINDFASTVAKTALWIAESQMHTQTQEVIHANIDFLPLKSYSQIRTGNALWIDWEEVIPKHQLNYIIGNPPFLGARVMDKSQKLDLLNVFEKRKGAGNLDFVAGWYLKAAQMMQNTKIETALVSTNSICQGEQASLLWKILFEEFGAKINFAHRTFKWQNEAKAKDQAAVHCVIIGFANFNKAEKVIFDGEVFEKVAKINEYLIEADPVLIDNRSEPISKLAPKARSGNKPIDGGFYLFEKEEMTEFIAKEPNSQKFFKTWYGAQEFIYNKPRYCLWLGNANPSELRRMPLVMERISQVRDFRLKSPSAGTRKIANLPTHFHVETIPQKPFLILPLTSSENREYVPIGFLTDENLASNALVVVADATMFDFGILTSSVFMAWMRAVCGRMENRYRITKDNVYSNFPWPQVSPEQRAQIEATAQGILDARAQFPQSSLADLYDRNSMPKALHLAHQANDRAVMAAYGMRGTHSESDRVKRLFAMYERLTADK